MTERFRDMSMRDKALAVGRATLATAVIGLGGYGGYKYGEHQQQEIDASCGGRTRPNCITVVEKKLRCDPYGSSWPSTCGEVEVEKIVTVTPTRVVTPTTIP